MREEIRIAICDDEAGDRGRLAELISKYLDQNQQIASTAVFEAGDALLASDQAFDIVFLDIFMEGRNGISTAKDYIAKGRGARIVFISSSNEFAAESYEADALCYLVKPLDERKLYAVLDRYFSACRALKTIDVKVRRLDKSVYVADIIWVEAQKHECVLHTRQGDITTRTSFGALCEKLAPFDFVRPIRYALVSLAAISEVPNREVALATGARVPVAQNEREQVRQAFADYKMKTMLGRMGGGL